MTLTLEYWRDNQYYVGRVLEIPGVFSQGNTLEELERNIAKAYELLLADSAPLTLTVPSETKEIEISR
jgi:predicted RNase H-like HicB family nuclease